MRERAYVRAETTHNEHRLSDLDPPPERERIAVSISCMLHSPYVPARIYRLIKFGAKSKKLIIEKYINVKAPARTLFINDRNIALNNCNEKRCCVRSKDD